MVDPPPPTGADADAERTAPSLTVVDDDPAIRRFVRQVAEQAGWRVVECGDGDELLRALADGPRPTLVLLDVVMPGTDGIEVLRTVARRHPDLPVALLSGAEPLFGESAAAFARATSIELVDSLRKPIGPEAIRALLGRLA